MSSSSAQQLANFRIISTISQHRFACRLIVFLLSRHNSSSLYVAKQALALFLIPYPCNGGAPCFLTIVQETSRKSIRLLFAYQVHTRPRLSVTLQQSRSEERRVGKECGSRGRRCGEGRHSA